MSKPQFTQGPWEVDDGDTDAIGVFSTEDGDPICYLSARANDGTGIRGRPRDEANANLIAAAPDLYKACEAAAEALNNATAHMRDRNVDKPGVIAALANARAALAKARGEVTP